MWLSDSQSKITKLWINLEQIIDNFCIVEIGVGLTAFGLFFMAIGVMMLFDGGLMAIGNVSKIILIN